MTATDRNSLDKLTDAINRLAAIEEEGLAHRRDQFRRLEQLAVQYMPKPEDHERPHRPKKGE